MVALTVSFKLEKAFQFSHRFPVLLQSHLERERLGEGRDVSRRNGWDVLRELALHFCGSLSSNQRGGELQFNRSLVGRMSHGHT